MRNDNTKVVAIGGGTGLSTMLRGLKNQTRKITAIVSVADDGGSSGILRGDYGMLPPGDVRSCIAALAETDPVFDELLSYRFKDGTFKGHSLGNLFLAALNEMSASFDEAVDKLSHALGVVGKIYPVTNEEVTLSAILEDGRRINGESHIGHRNGMEGKVDHVFLTPARPKAVEGAIEALDEADIIVLGPGSLYTSIIPNLLVDGIPQAIKRSKAIKIYVCNLMSQAGETENYTVHDHLEAIEKHSYKGIVDFVIANNEPIPQSIIDRYAEENAYMVEVDAEKFTDPKTLLVQGDLLLVQDEKLRHNFSRLARAIMILQRRIAGRGQLYDTN